MGAFFVIEIIVPGQINLPYIGAFLFVLIVPGQLNFFYLVMQSFLPYNKIVATNTTIKTIEEKK